MKNRLYHLCPMWLLACLQGFVISVLLMACSGNPKVDAVIARADSLMASRPDSALLLLDSAGAQMAGAPKSVRMRYQLLRHQAMNKAYVTFTSDSVMNAVVEYYDNKGDANDQLLAHYLLGCVYRDLDQVPHAVDCYQDAIAKADTASADCDYLTVSCVYSQMAWLFHQQLLLSEEITARNNASYYALRANKIFYAIYNRDLSVSAFILQNNNDSAVALLQKVQKQYRENGYKQEELLSSLTLVYLYVERLQRFAEAKILIDRFEKESDLFDSHHELPPSKRQFYYYKGKYFEGINRLDSAEYYYRKVYRPNMTPIEKNPMYKGLLNVFRLRHQSDSIAKYSVLYCNANDSSVIIKDQQQTALLAASYDYVYFKNQSIEKAELSQTRLYYLYVLTVVIVVLIIVGIVSHNQYVKQREKKQTEIKLLTSECMSLGEKLAGKEHELRSLEDNHKRTVETIQKELDAAKKESTDFEDKYDELQSIIGKLNAQHEQEKKKLEGEISSYKGEIADLERKITIYAGVEQTTPFLNLGVVKRVLFYADRPDKALSEGDVNSLIAATMEFYPAFIHDLKNTPKIGDVGLKVGILVALNIKPRDIGHLLGMPYNQISNIKQDLNVGLFKEKTARTLYQNLCMRYHIKQG